MTIKTLLPSGCYDLLPPYARQERESISKLMSIFDRYGYEQVAPPLLEYTESLLAGRGAALATQTFRVMDSSAAKVMGIRADHTIQIARIAATRLAGSPKPLRLSYAGNILRMQPEQLRNERQLRQVGIELIGASSYEADAEVIVVAAQALLALGIQNISVDINLPAVVAGLLSGEALENEALQSVLQAVEHKDSAAIRRSPLACAAALAGLIESAGEAGEALVSIEELVLPAFVKAQMDELSMLVATLTKALPQTAITLDVTEKRGLEYHSGISFAIYAQGASVELGRGGRYRVPTNGDDLEATGFTLYIENLRHLLPATAPAERVLVMASAGDPVYVQLAQQGYVTLHGLHSIDPAGKARELGCCGWWQNGTLHKL